MVGDGLDSGGGGRERGGFGRLRRKIIAGYPGREGGLVDLIQPEAFLILLIMM